MPAVIAASSASARASRPARPARDRPGRLQPGEQAAGYPATLDQVQASQHREGRTYRDMDRQDEGLEHQGYGHRSDEPQVDEPPGPGARRARAPGGAACHAHQPGPHPGAVSSGPGLILAAGVPGG